MFNDTCDIGGTSAKARRGGSNRRTMFRPERARTTVGGGDGKGRVRGESDRPVWHRAPSWLDVYEANVTIRLPVEWGDRWPKKSLSLA